MVECRLIAFDIETHRPFEKDELPGSRPIGLTAVGVAETTLCLKRHAAAGSASSAGGAGGAGAAAGGAGAGTDDSVAGEFVFSPVSTRSWITPSVDKHLGASDVRSIVDWLHEQVQKAPDSTVIVSWSGTLSDFPLLVQACGDDDDDDDVRRMCTALALHHVDLPYTLLCDRGHMVGLSTVLATVMPSWHKITDSSTCDELWKAGEFEKLALHVTQDARGTLLLYQISLLSGELQWQNRRGKLRTWTVPVRVSRSGMRWPQTVEQSSALPLPRGRWDKPITPRTCRAWMHLAEDARGEDPFLKCAVYGAAATPFTPTK